MNGDLVAQFALTLNGVSGLGPTKLRRLLDSFATPELVLAAPVSLLTKVPGISAELARRIACAQKSGYAQREMEAAQQAGVKITTLFDEEYPSSLRHLYDPPLILYSRGSWAGVEEKALAIVGSRHASYYGMNHARRFAQVFAERGVTVISGLARGIDTAAHEGSLSAGGRTLAIIGSGLNCLYPRENVGLAQKIVEEGGALISELPMNCAPSKSTFPARNRLVSAWGQGVLVIEAPQRSGSLITAHCASDQGRRVFALPGSVDTLYSSGCHALIREGATLVTHPEQVLEEFSWEEEEEEVFVPTVAAAPASSPPVCDSEGRQICDWILEGKDTIDSLCWVSQLPVYTLNQRLMRLQIARIIRPLAGGRFEVIS